MVTTRSNSNIKSKKPKIPSTSTPITSKPKQISTFEIHSALEPTFSFSGVEKLVDASCVTENTEVAFPPKVSYVEGIDEATVMTESEIFEANEYVKHDKKAFLLANSENDNLIEELESKIHAESMALK